MYESDARSSTQSGTKSRNVRRWQVIGTAAVATAMVGVGLGVASADENSAATSREGNIVCPAVAGELPAVPASAQAEITSNLQLLNKQVAEAQNRFKTSGGQGGANFVVNAILNPLKGKRVSTINRMATAIGRKSTKPDLNVEALAGCEVSLNGTAVVEPDVQPAGTLNETAAAGTQAGGNAEAGGNAQAGNNAATPLGVIVCPSIAGDLPAVPASAQQEVTSNLELLNKQVAEAQARLNKSVGVGGPQFVNNAIINPLKSKRFATINRIETAIGRQAVKPDLNAEGNSICKVEANGKNAEEPAVQPAGEAAGNEAAAGNEGANTAAANGKITCPAVNVSVAIPASAQAEVASNLALLDKQIAEAQKRLDNNGTEGGKNFVANAIINPLAGKRLSTINRIETAIGRQSTKPDLNAEGLSKCTVQ